MSVQLALRFDEVPVTCETQKRYHSIAPCLAGKRSAEEQADALGLSYSTICRWLRQFREEGMPGLFPATEYPREPQTPEHVIVTLLYYKTCAPQASGRELARVLSATTDHRIHHETVKALLERYPLWRYPNFQRLIQYQAPSDPQKLREEVVNLRQQGWTEKRIAQLLRCSRKTVMKWLRRARQAESQPDDRQLWLLDLSRAPHRTARKVFFGAMHAVLQLQKKYGYAGAWRLKGYLEADYGIYLSEPTVRKIMALNRRVHLAPQRPVAAVKARELREGPPKSSHPFQHVYVDLRYLDAKPAGVQLYSTLLLEGLSRTILAGSLTPKQEVGVILHVYFQALLRWGLWEELISDHGGQFISHDFQRVNKRLGIHHHMYEKGHPWQNLIESQFGIQARLGEYHWQRCKTIEEAVEFHRELIRDHNRLPHWAHHRRNDGNHSPLKVLGEARGKQIEPADLQRAFGQRYCQRRTDARGFAQIGRWKIYIEEALPRTHIHLSFWDGRLRAEYQSQILIAVGLIPALHVSRNVLRIGLQQSSRSVSHSTRRALVVAEVALALTLLVGAGLLLRSLQRLFAISPGFDSSSMLTMQVQASGRKFDKDATDRFFARALESVRQTPGVTAAAFTSQLPLSGDYDEYGVGFEPGSDERAEGGYSSFRYAVSPDYFEAMGIPLRSGRLPDARDVAAAPPVAVISESLAKRKFGGQDPLGKRLRVGSDESWRVIVGVVGDVKQMSLAAPQSDAVYTTAEQYSSTENVRSLVVRARGDAAALAPAIRKAIWSVDKDQPIARVATMDALLAATAAERRFALILFEAFGLVALALACAGIYGALSGSVAERTREIGVRMALGAERRNVLGMILWQGLKLTLSGVGAGLLAAWAATRLLNKLLYGVSATDPLTFGGVALLLTGVALIACYLPARRATKVDPLVAIRQE